MNIVELTELIKSGFPALEILSAKGGHIEIKDAASHCVSLLSGMKDMGFLQMSLISAVDWDKEGRFELVYNLVSWEHKLTGAVHVDLSRTEPEAQSVINLWPTAKYYEWDINEFFGIVFRGNPMNGKTLFLEGWDDIPPMRKDFDPRAYSDRKYPSRDYDYKIYDRSEVIE